MRQPALTKSVSVWQVEFHDDFDPEFDALEKDVQNELLATALVIEHRGPEAGRPHVGVLNNPTHPNMKELRFSTNNGSEVWRAAFAFDPLRKAIVLVAADKQGKDQQKFYKKLLNTAIKRFDAHLQKNVLIEQQALGGSKEKSLKNLKKKR